ncbi:hypothetical protein AV530_018150 [Patagioenas fasciata monilis]|uniref:Uncharacterized protein n=1 Tax=Patagioenas fasciata monilis TaxID=372326 RepID=A0A1V4KL57_PATFA|nr:hypothetical protein AV530_018150 [Patagioenas fasciata monilis]
MGSGNRTKPRSTSRFTLELLLASRTGLSVQENLAHESSPFSYKKSHKMELWGFPVEPRSIHGCEVHTTANVKSAVRTHKVETSSKTARNGGHSKLAGKTQI